MTRTTHPKVHLAGLLAATLATLGATDALAASSHGLRFTADPASALTVLKVETERGQLDSLSFRATETVRSGAPATALGRRVGTLEVGTTSIRQLRLRMPSRRSREMTLAESGSLRVVLRPEARHMLSVYGLPDATKTVSITLNKNGRGIIAAVKRRCPGTVATGLFAQRTGATDVKLKDTIRCGRA